MDTYYDEPGGKGSTGHGRQRQPRPVWVIGPTRGSITAQKTAACLSENESGWCRASDHRMDCGASSPCSPQPAIVFPNQPAVVPHSPSPGNIRGVEIRSKCRLINDRHADLQTWRVNVTTPLARLLPNQMSNSSVVVLERPASALEIVSETFLDQALRVRQRSCRHLAEFRPWTGNKMAHPACSSPALAETRNRHAFRAGWPKATV